MCATDCDSFCFCISVESLAGVGVLKVEVHLVGLADELLDCTHSLALLKIKIPIRAQKSNPIVTTGLLICSIDPIVQALAPYLSAGCCAVNGLVPRALLIGWYYYIIICRNCQSIRLSIYDLFIEYLIQKFFGLP